ncbi:AraC family transcriptional regulator [Zobellia sp. B3R18]|uniref:AraC family transcriptional regulator n=1 Tax=Zobellia sp. B3R18 TaxID=2841568 RepID=UPI001C0754BE|nr:two-component regulator propeller domain-containing protein [Zobellia sp. B3R18]MBU2975352.1 helix-turn-helix domain-containing protein [Zobellia sp. B3R18]
MKRSPLLLLTLFMWMLGTSVFAQHIKFKTLSTNDGLSNNSITDIVSDHDGILWIATWDGLNSYNGNTFTVYKHDLKTPKSIAGNNIERLKKDREGHIWILTKEKKLSRYIGDGQFQNFVFDDAPKYITLTKNGNIGIKTSTSSYTFTEGKFVKSEFVEEKQEDKGILKGILLSKYPNSIINDVLKDRSGNIWYATRKNGVYIIPNNASNRDNEQIDHYFHDLYDPYSFKSNEVEKIYEDGFGNIWLGHKDGGLSLAYTGSEQITTITPHPYEFPHLPNETIRAITTDFKSRIWLGYYTKGVFYYDQTKECFVKFKIKEVAKNSDWERIRSLYTDKSGEIWIGTYAGIIRIKNGNYSLYQSKDIPELPNDRNYSFQEDNANNIWVACWGGAAKFNLKTNQFESFKGQEALSSYHIRNIAYADNELLISTENEGLLLLDIPSGTLKDITINDGILGNSVYSSFKDKQSGYYWIASLGGISIYDKKNRLIHNITEKEGLPSHMVYGMLLDSDKIWISTTKGIAAVDRNDFSVTSLNMDEGWQGREFSEGAYYQDRKGSIFFAGINGLNHFSPTTINITKELPKLKVHIDNSNDFSQGITKNYTENSLEVSIEPIVFTKDPNNQILYKLVGYDNEFKSFLDSPIQYTDLPDGEYIFEVKNSLSQDLAFKSIPIVIRKPFYKTPWFYILLLATILLAFTGWVLVRNRNIAKNQKKLELKIEERTQTINRQKERLVKVNETLDEKNKEINRQREELLNSYHQLKNEDFEIEKFKTFVLSEFKEPVSKIIENSKQLEKNEGVKQSINNESNRLITLLSEWDYLTNSKDIGELKKSATKIKQSIKILVDGLSAHAKKSKINLDYSLNIEDQWVELDSLRFKLFFKYLFNDILKYISKNSFLKVIVRTVDTSLELVIESNSKVLIDNFFSIQHYSPYYRAANTLLTAMEGTLTVKNEENLTISALLPIKVVDTNQKTEEVLWKHLDLNQKLPSDKNNILIFCNDNDYLPAFQLFDDPENNLVFERTSAAISSAIKHVNIHCLVLYNITIDEQLVQLFHLTKNNGKQMALPTLYISEDIDHALRIQTTELGVDAFIQLPVSKSFIQSKLTKLLSVRKEFANHSAKHLFLETPFTEDQTLSVNEKLVKKALKLINENLHDPSFNVQKLKEMLFVSKIKCYRAFKEVLQQSPSDVIIKLRLQKAEYLLQNRSLNISEISTECGFNDSKYFSRLFKKNFDYSPKGYRAKMAQP